MEKIENLKIWTSNSTEERFYELVENNVLPVIIIGISPASPLKKWRNTMIHFLNLGPNPELWKKLMSDEINQVEFETNYLKDLWRTVDVFHILEQLEILTHLAHSEGVCLLGGLSENIDPTREAIAKYFNRTNILKNSVTEWKL